MTKKEHKLLANTLNVVLREPGYSHLNHVQSVGRTIVAMRRVLNGTQKNFDSGSFMGVALEGVNPSDLGIL